MTRRLLSRFLLVALALLASDGLRAETPRATVDPEIELVSAACRLALVPGFDRATPNTYPWDLEERLRGFEDHDAVMFVRERRIHNQTPAAVWLAVGANLERDGDTLRLAPDDGSAGSIPRAWRDRYADACVRNMDRLRRDSGFDSLLEEHRATLTRCEAELDLLLSTRVASAWIEDFFGEPLDERVSVHPAPLANGRVTLVRIKNEGEPVRSAVVVPVFLWRDGAPVYPPVMAPLIERHFIEACAARYVEDHAEALGPPATRLYDALAKANRQRPATSPLALVEAMLTDAACANLTASTDGLRAGIEQAEKAERDGTPAVVGLLDLLDDYRQNREQYATLSDFTPRLVTFLKKTADAHGG